jgi:hypothetical protein
MAHGAGLNYRIKLDLLLFRKKEKVVTKGSVPSFFEGRVAFHLVIFLSCMQFSQATAIWVRVVDAVVRPLGL